MTRKIVSEMTYNVSMGTLNPTTTTGPHYSSVTLAQPNPYAKLYQHPNPSSHNSPASIAVWAIEHQSISQSNVEYLTCDQQWTWSQFTLPHDTETKDNKKN